MSIKSILVPIGDPANAGSSLALALELGARLGARVTALYPVQEPTETLPVFSEGAAIGVVDDLISQIEREAAERLAAAREALLLACSAHGVSPVESFAETGFAVRLATPTGTLERLIAQEGRVHDLVVMACPDRNDPSLSPALQAALMETGRPLLIAPTVPPASFATRVAVAWNGGLEAARALGAALDLLQGAEHIVVVAIDDERPQGPAAEAVVGYLAAHDLVAQARQRPAAGKAVAEALLDEAYEAGADLLVMGAYSRSRLSEIILGGATRDVLANLDLPVLMMH